MNEQHLYSIVVDYDGGTFISQEIAVSPAEAIQFWSRNTSSIGFLKLTKSEQIELQQNLFNCTPTPLNGIVNGWCEDSISDSREMILINCFKMTEVPHEQ